jgi:hypothetical protein
MAMWYIPTVRCEPALPGIPDPFDSGGLREFDSRPLHIPRLQGVVTQKGLEALRSLW